MKERIIKTGKFAFSKGKFVLMLAGIVILLLLIQKVGLDELLAVWNSMNKFYVLLAVIPWVLTIVFGAYRLKKIVNSDIGFFEIFKIYSYGYLLNYASPIQGFGAGAKIAMLRMKNVKISKSSASISSEIGYDIILTLVIAAAFLAYHLNFVKEQIGTLIDVRLIAVGFIIILAATIVLFLFRKKVFIKEFFSHILICFKPKNMLYIMPLTMLQWLLPSLVIWLFFIASGSPISLWIVIGSLAIGFILGMASFIPGGLGVRDAITAYIYTISSVSIEKAIAIAIFNRFFTIGSVLLIVIFIKISDSFKTKNK